VYPYEIRCSNMKNLPLEIPHYEQQIAAFKAWLKTLGYSDSACYNLPHHLREFFHWLEQLGVYKTDEITNDQTANYFGYLASRKNQRRGGSLSASFLNKHRAALSKYSEFSVLTNGHKIPLKIAYQKALSSLPEIVTTKEIKQLYAACEDGPRGYRDLAMLALYYGCGLRRKEGAMLNVQDIDLTRKLIHVRCTKNGRERYVPLSEYSAKMLEIYLYDGRHLLTSKQVEEDGLLIGRWGRRINSESLAQRLRLLAEYTGNKTLKDKNITLHQLRHSVATHLLEAGMPLHKISKFLGHRSLDSTQIYTHVLATTQTEKS
jgi:integrase/recombinase XerD